MHDVPVTVIWLDLLFVLLLLLLLLLVNSVQRQFHPAAAAAEASFAACYTNQQHIAGRRKSTENRIQTKHN